MKPILFYLAIMIAIYVECALALPSSAAKVSNIQAEFTFNAKNGGHTSYVQGIIIIISIEIKINKLFNFIFSIGIINNKKFGQWIIG